GFQRSLSRDQRSWNAQDLSLGEAMKREPTAYLVADSLLIVGDEVLLVQRKNEPFQGKWGIPGGFVDPDEKILDAANRELEEETGISNVQLNNSPFMVILVAIRAGELLLLFTGFV